MTKKIDVRKLHSILTADEITVLHQMAKRKNHTADSIGKQLFKSAIAVQAIMAGIHAKLGDRAVQLYREYPWGYSNPEPNPPAPSPEFTVARVKKQTRIQRHVKHFKRQDAPRYSNAQY